MEVLLELGALVQPLIDWANGTPYQDDPIEPPWRTEITDELDAIRAFDAAKASGGEAIPLEDALSEIEQDRQRR